MDCVTGAFSYTGKYITRRLLARGKKVMTLTGHPERPNEFGGQVKAVRYDFEHPKRLAAAIEGVDTLYNTYWVRFDHGNATFSRAVDHTRLLFSAAQQAGVRRVVHVSITNPTLDSPLPYFSGKARLEAALKDSGLSYAILRPTVIYSLEDILLNNIAYMLRRFPLFGVPGDGQYRLQPVHVDDMADLAVQAGAAAENCTLDVVGPEIFTFDELLRLVAHSIGRPARLVHLPPRLAVWAANFIGRALGDTTLTWEEYLGLKADLLVSPHPATAPTRLSEWLKANAAQLGVNYASEIARHY